MASTQKRRQRAEETDLGAGASTAEVGANAKIARVVLPAGLSASVDAARSALVAVAEAMRRQRQSCQYLITPGGFVSHHPDRAFGGPAGWRARPGDDGALRAVARDILGAVLAPPVASILKPVASFVTLAIDVHGTDRIHGEFVASVDVRSEPFSEWWTGKSYPAPGQEHRLVHLVELESHCQELSGERVLVLGCHDLSIFSRRGGANLTRGSLRWQRARAMRSAFRDFDPEIVLHHPHGTDTAQTWAASWSGLREDLPSVGSWASAIRHENPWDEDIRQDLATVLLRTRTRREPTIDVVVAPRD